MEVPPLKYNTPEYKRNAQRKYYEAHKADKNDACVKNAFKREFGADYVDKVYTECEGDMSVIRDIFKMKRWADKLKNVPAKYSELLK
jgi:hypothetical protein